jgi:reactive intermediate/imine deaminase
MHRSARRRRVLVSALAAFVLGACAAPPARVERVVLPNLGRLPAFSHATIAGDLVFVSGTLGTSGAGVEVVQGGAGAETAQALRNVEAILGAAGSTWSDVAKCNVYLVDLTDFPAMNEAWGTVFPHDPPARTTVGVRELVLGARVELECIALRRGGRS